MPEEDTTRIPTPTDEDTQRVAYVAVRWEYPATQQRDLRLLGCLMFTLVVLTLICGGSALGALLSL